jgi:hypothetical protein
MRKLIFLSFLVLAACASPADRAMRKSPDFKAGYSDGCASASLQGANARDNSLTRDDDAYGSNKAYHSGWGEGLGACRVMNMPQNPGGGAMQMPPSP